MERISENTIIDLLPYNNGFIFVEKIPLPARKFKIVYSIYNFSTCSIQPITKGAYLLNKFGPAYKQITEQLGNVVLCQTGTLYDRRVLVLYPTGEAGIFTKEGELTWSGDFFYHDAPVSGIAVEGKYFWCVVPQSNCVIRYNSYNMKVTLRIGSASAATFAAPEHICHEDGLLYVTSAASGKIKTVDPVHYTVKEYLRFDEPVRKFLKMGNQRIALLDSGLYLL